MDVPGLRWLFKEGEVKSSGPGDKTEPRPIRPSVTASEDAKKEVRGQAIDDTAGTLQDLYRQKGDWLELVGTAQDAYQEGRDQAQSYGMGRKVEVEDELMAGRRKAMEFAQQIRLVQPEVLELEKQVAADEEDVLHLEEERQRTLLIAQGEVARIDGEIESAKGLELFTKDQLDAAELEVDLRTRKLRNDEGFVNFDQSKLEEVEEGLPNWGDQREEALEKNDRRGVRRLETQIQNAGRDIQRLGTQVGNGRRRLQEDTVQFEAQERAFQAHTKELSERKLQVGRLTGELLVAEQAARPDAQPVEPELQRARMAEVLHASDLRIARLAVQVIVQPLEEQLSAAEQAVQDSLQELAQLGARDLGRANLETLGTRLADARRGLQGVESQIKGAERTAARRYPHQFGHLK